MPACVGIGVGVDGNGKRAQNGIMTNGNAHPLIMGDDAVAAAVVNGTVVGLSTMGLKEERMDELPGVGGGVGIHMGGMNGVGNMGLEMMGMGMQA